MFQVYSIKVKGQRSNKWFLRQSNENGNYYDSEYKSKKEAMIAKKKANDLFKEILNQQKEKKSCN